MDVRFVTLASLVATACAAQPKVSAVELDLQLSAPAAFDRVLVFAELGEVGGPPILTPGLIAANQMPPATATIYDGAIVNHTWDLVTPTSTLHYVDHFAEATPVLDHIGVLVQRLDAATGYHSVGFGETTVAAARTGYTGTIELAPMAAEVWGAPGSGQPACLRVATPSATTYVIDSADRDCDTMPDAIDCQPDAYCDPSATSVLARSACACH